VKFYHPPDPRIHWRRFAPNIWAQYPQTRATYKRSKSPSYIACYYTGPPTHSVWTSNGRWCLSSSSSVGSVTLQDRRWRRAASSLIIAPRLHGGPVGGYVSCYFVLWTANPSYCRGSYGSKPVSDYTRVVLCLQQIRLCDWRWSWYSNCKGIIFSSPRRCIPSTTPAAGHLRLGTTCPPATVDHGLRANTLPAGNVKLDSPHSRSLRPL